MIKRGILLVAIMLFALFLVYAESFSDLIEQDFNGTFNNTFYNSSGFIQLNNSVESSINSTVNELIGNETGLISYWRFNESSWNGTLGSVKDVLGKNNGTAINGANTLGGLFGNAGSFDGINDRINIPNQEEINPNNESFTITGWAKSYARASGAASQWQIYVGKRTSAAADGYYLGLNQGSGLNFMVGDGSNRFDTALSGGSGYAPISYNNWFHFAAVINRTSNQILLYVNGTLLANRTITNLNKINNSANLSIGLDYGQIGVQGGYPVNGSIDEVAFWNKALNSSEILDLYQKGASVIIFNSTNISSGTYESEVKDAGGIVRWNNISFNNIVSSGLTTSIGNIFLMHLDGNANDENNINNGAVKGATVTEGKTNQGYYFDGNNDYIEITDSNSLDLNSSFSIGAWINFSSLPGAGEWDGFITKGLYGENTGNDHNYYFGIDNSVWGTGYGISFGFENSEGKNNATRYQFTPSLGKWYHIIGVFDDSANTMAIYMNGSLVAQTSGNTLVPITQNQPVFIGRNQNGSSSINYFNGVIDEVFISNLSLSSDQISNIYNSQSGIKFQIRAGNANPITSDYSSFYYGYSNFSLDSRYFQYKAFFEQEDKLYNASLSYISLGDSDVIVALDYPSDNYLTNEYNINVTCSVSSTSELENITVYYDKFGWIPYETKIISGTSNTTTFILGEINSAVKWNCLACNSEECAFASNNKTIIGDITSPEISLISPENNNISSSSNVNFIFNASDNLASSLSCNLLINNSVVASNSSVLNGIYTSISYNFNNGYYSWKINCSDGLNYGESSERNINISVSSSYVPFWAKANTHAHTTNSDGDSSPATVVRLYQTKGHSILAITDHGFVTNCTPFTNSSFLCINSEEWTSTKHVIRINVSTPYNNAIGNMQSAVNAANGEGGFAIVAHPNWSSTIWSFSDLTNLQNYTAMEIYNKVIERLSPDPYATLKWDDVLKSGKRIFGIAADDMHQVNVDLGYGFTKVYMPEFTKQAYIESMRSGHFYSSQGPLMDAEPFNMLCDELNSYEMGETGNCSAVKLNATLSASNSSFIMSNITLIKDGVVINLATCSSQNCSFSYSENVSSSGYYRLEGRDSSNKMIWSNPIWVTKIALPAIITINSPQNNSLMRDYTPLLNISLNQHTSLWYNINGGENLSLCSGCSSYTGNMVLREGQNIVSIYSNNSDDILSENKIYISLNFNKSMEDEFQDNSSLFSLMNSTWNKKISLGIGHMFGNFVFHPIITSNNITSFNVEWEENNTENAKGEGQRTPIILKYRFGGETWTSLDSQSNYIVNGTEIIGLNNNNLSIMLDFEKNPLIPIDLLRFKISWTEFTVPLISNVSVSLVTANSATISWNTDLSSNSSLLYGTSSSLGNFKSLNDSTISHSINLDGLNPSTGYFYKIISCTDASCSQQPQDPYPAYSFTTQSLGSSNIGGGGGGSSGGGSSGGFISNLSSSKIEIFQIEEIIMNPGESRTLSVEIKNSGNKYLNKCKIISDSEWISSSQVKGLAAGEKADFIFSVSLPNDAEIKNYNLNLILKCDEASSSTNLGIIIPSKLQIIIKDIKQEGNDFNVLYLVKDISGETQDVQLNYWLENDGSRIKEGVDSFSIGANEEFERKITIDAAGLSGEFVFGFDSKILGTIKENVIIGSSGLSGMAIFGETSNFATGVIIAFLVIVLVILVVRKLRLKKEEKVREGIVRIKR